MSKRWFLPLLCLAFAEALVIGAHGGGYLVLVKALSNGTPRIDAYHWWTPDVAWWHGHYYSPKAPLLAFLVLPVSVLLHDLGLQPANPLAHVQSLEAGGGVSPLANWPLVLVASTAASLGLLVLVRNRAEKVEAGYGTVAAVTVGAGTLLLPFSTLLYNHVLSALLAFAAFVVLWREREHAPRLLLVGLGGALAGLAIMAEYPTGLVVAVLAVYALSRTRSVARGAAYVGGVVAGVLPLLAYDSWAFGSPFHVSLVNTVSITGNSGHDHLNATGGGFFGIAEPRLRVALDLLFAHRGLLSISPVLAVAAVGLVRMGRNGWRAEAIVIAAVFLSYLVFNAGLYLPFGGPFGGDTPGPRYLIVTVPFLGVALAPAYRAARWPTVALALGSTVMMLGAVATPLLGNDDTTQWARRVGRNDFTDTVLTHLFGWGGIAGFFPVVLLVAAALVLAYRSLPGGSSDQAAVAVFALLAWVLVMTRAAPLLQRGELGAAAVLVLVVALALTASTVAEGGPAAALPALLLVPVAVVLYRWPAWTIVLALVVACAALLGVVRRRPIGPATEARTSPGTPGS